VQGSRLRRDFDVVATVERLRAAHERAGALELEDLLKHLAGVIEYDATAALGPGAMPDPRRAAESGALRHGAELVITEKMVKLRPPDKITAIREYAELAGLGAPKRHEVKVREQIPEILRSLTEDQLRRLEEGESWEKVVGEGTK
jgi:hypothetical protein